MDLEEFYGMAPKPKAAGRTTFNPANTKAIEVQHSKFHKSMMLVASNDGPVSLITPELKVHKKMTVENFDALVEQIFDMV